MTFKCLIPFAIDTDKYFRGFLLCQMLISVFEPGDPRILGKGWEAIQSLGAGVTAQLV